MTIVHTKALLRERLGLSFEGHAEERLRRAVADQMGALAIASETAYLARLRSDESALHALTALVTVKETYFYREPHHLRLLVERLGPELLRGRSPGHPVRILSAGCATGEEPYSIAIALREAWGEDAERLFRIEACDVDRSALRQALNGRYRPLAFRAMPQELIDRWFAPHRNGERTLAEPIRRAVAFRPLSLLAAPYPADLAGQDLIFYRNLSIYFDRETRQAVLTRLRALLRPGDRLVLTERHPSDHPTLANAFAGDRQVRVHFKDGYTAPEAFMPPPERRGLVLMDPAFELQGEFQRLLDAVQRIQRRWATATVAIWYPIGETGPSERFQRAIQGLGIPALCAELGLYPYDRPRGLSGSGMVVLNPPWQIDLALARLLPEILARLRQDERGQTRLDWLVAPA